MRVGGRDTVLAGPSRGDEARFIVDGLHAFWPDIVVQRASSYELTEGPDDPSIEGMTEFFVYPSEAAFEAWRYWRDGAEPAPMVHVIVGDKTVTYVTGGDNPRLEVWMRAIFSNLERHRREE